MSQYDDDADKFADICDYCGQFNYACECEEEGVPREIVDLPDDQLPFLPPKE